MEIREMNIEQIEERKSAIIAEMDVEGANLDALEEEMRSLTARANEIKADASAKAEECRKVAEGEGDIIREIIKEDRKTMDVREYRNSAEYMDAYAEYIKTGKADECRALLTQNVGEGTIAVPDFVLDEVKHAWDNNEIMSRVTKVSIPGNLKVNFEKSAGDAVAHIEGSGEVAEEELVEGVVTLTPVMFKKWIGVSDEVMSLRGEAFLRYIYAEITHKIVKSMADELIKWLTAYAMSPEQAGYPAVPKFVQAPALGTVAQAMSLLSDEAENPVVIMNKQTWGMFKQVQYSGNYAVDPFEGLTVLFSSKLPPASIQSTQPYMYVGDLGYGALANFPNGEGVEFIFDEFSRKKEDMVEVLGKEYAAIGVVAPNAFVGVATVQQG